MAEVHVLPVGDQVEHLIPGGWDGHGVGCSDCRPCAWLTLEAEPGAPDVECVCHPAVEHVPNDSGPDGWLITHHSLDGRELHEEVTRG